MSRFDASLVARAAQAVAGALRPSVPPAPGSVPPAAGSVPPAAGSVPPAGTEALSGRDQAVAVALALCRRFEGFYPAPYLCPAGVPTIGYGATYYLDGRSVTLRDPPISREAAERLLQRMVERVYLPAVLKLCPGVTHPGRLAALIDFCFNLGAGNLSASTLRRRVNAGEWHLVPVELRRWNKAGGVVLRGLTLRREAEIAHV